MFHSKLPIRRALASIAAVLPIASVSAQWAPVPLHTFAPQAQLESFGGSLAIDQGTLVVGAWNADGAVPRTGAVYVYVRSGGAWVQQARLYGSDNVPYGSFGSSVAIAGDVLAVGAPHYQGPGMPLPQGRAYVFRRTGSTWVEEANVPAPLASTNPLFGSSLAWIGEHLFVGAPNEAGVGAVYRFDHVGASWNLAQTLARSAPQGNPWFGQALAAYGSRLAVGTDNAGVYVFEPTGPDWIETVMIQPARLAGDGLGSAIALHQDTLLVGAPGADILGTDQGAAFFWTHGPSGWEGSAPLFECVPTGFFGSQVCLDQDTALVTSRYDDEAGPYVGSVHVYRREANQWTLQTKILPAPVVGNFVGAALLDGDHVFLGAWQAEGAGRVWEFQIVPASYPSVCVATATNGLCGPCFQGDLWMAGTGCENSAVNCGTQLTATGLASLAAEDLVLRARGLPRIAWAVLFQGSTLGPAVPFGAGAQCVGGSLLRIATRSASGGGWTYPLAGDALLSVAGSVPPGGGVVHYQLAYRDSVGFCGGLHSNVTNAVSVTWTP